MNDNEIIKYYSDLKNKNNSVREFLLKNFEEALNAHDSVRADRLMKSCTDEETRCELNQIFYKHVKVSNKKEILRLLELRWNTETCDGLFSLLYNAGLIELNKIESDANVINCLDSLDQ